MSIYTITLKRELLNEQLEAGQSDADQATQAPFPQAADRRAPQDKDRKLIAAAPIDADRQQQQAASARSAAQAQIDDSRQLSRPVVGQDFEQQAEENEEADWLDCVCSAQTIEDKENLPLIRQHSSECLEARREQLRQLEARAREIVHSVNVTLEVQADLSEASRIIWYKNKRQLTSNERPVFYAPGRKSSRDESAAAATTTSGNQSSESTTFKSIKRTRSSKRRSEHQGYSIEETKTELIEERLIDCERESGNNREKSEPVIEKCRQESSERGSKLTIFDLQENDYGQYTCRLIDLQGNQLNIHAQLKEDRGSKEDSCKRTTTTTTTTTRQQEEQLLKLRLSKLIAMDEVIEVKEGDVNIELGIQILPETNEDEELMSAEEKAEFIENTTINWFKDDVKLNQHDARTLKLFQFTYDKDEGFHRLIVRKATKETEGVYTCLVENESGTSSCSTQLVVGPGNKPKLTSQLQDVTVYAGQSLEFRIKSTGLPPIDSCQWFKDDELLIELASSAPSDQPIKSTSNERVSMARSEEWTGGARRDEDKVLIFKLCIDNLKLDDTGRYKCRINNDYGFDESACFVKVLQEIIEEHEEIEETIEETLRLGGGKRTTREEEEEVAEESREEELHRLDEQLEQQRDVKRQKGADGGRAPQFKRGLENRTLIVREEELEEQQVVVEETLIVTTIRESSSQQDQLKLKWLIDGQELDRASAGRSQSDLSDGKILSYKVENFYDETTGENWHKLTIVRQVERRQRLPSGKRQIECVASNEFGETKTSCQVCWVKRPRFLRSLEDTETHVGERVVLKVTLEEEEEEITTTTTTKTKTKTKTKTTTTKDVRFLHDGKLIYSSQRDGLDGRDFTSSAKSRVRVRSFEETVEVEEEGQEEEDESVSSRRRYSRTSTKRKPVRGRSYEITIENAQVDQQGTWECQAQNEAGTSSCRGELEVFAEPKIVTDLPSDVRVPPNKEIRLTVEASGSPIPVYSWFKDGLGIAEEEDRVFTETKTTTKTTTTSTTRRRSSVTSMREEDGVSISGETLIIRDARPEDAGVYQCKVENRLGQVESRECKMTVIGHGADLKGAPRILRDLSRDKLVYELDEGDTLTLKVLAEGQPKPSQHWFKDSEEILERETRFEREQVDKEYTLTCRRVRIDDSGTYKVVLRNELGETESQTVQVKVNKVTKEQESQRKPSAPSIILDSQDKIVGLGSNVSFDVEVAGHPKPTITWYKNGRRMTESSDGRVSFVEEEITTTTTTTTTITETGDEADKRERRETTTVHKLIINDVRESDEAIYSLKAENELGSNKSSLVSLSVDKRKQATDEVSESSASTKRQQEEEVVVEEETTTTTTTTRVTKQEQEELMDLEESEEAAERRKSKSKTKTTREEVEDEMEVDDEDEDEAARRRGKTTRTTTTTTKRTTTTTTEEDEEEQEEEDEETRREKSKGAKKSKIIEDEVEEEVEEEEEERSKRRTRSEQVDETTKVDQEETSKTSKKRDKVIKMDVDEEEIEEEEELDERKRRRSKQQQQSSESEKVKRRERDDEVSDETIDETTTTIRKSRGPRIISAPKEVLAGLGSSPELEVEFEEIITEETTTRVVEETKVTWLKNGQPIADRLLRDSHIELLERSGSQPNTKKRVLRINSLRSSDEGDYTLKVENPHGQAETEPIKLIVDRSMRPGQRPSITPADIKPVGEQKAPEVVGVPEEVVAGIGSSPQIEAQIQAEPKPVLTWFKDGQPITPEELKSGHLEVVDLPSEQPDVTRQALKINDLKPADVAAYHVKAENPLGEVESEPTNVRIDRSMGPRDEPLVTGLPEKLEDEVATFEDEPRSKDVAAPKSVVEAAPTIVSAPKEIIAGPGSNPQIEAEVAGSPAPQLTWLKDGQPVSDRDLRMGHVEIVDLPTDKPDVVKQALKINDMRPTDVADYAVKAENPLGSVESQPTSVKLDRSMSRRDEPIVKGLDGPEGQQTGEAPLKPQKRPSVGDDLPQQQAPAIVRVPDEIVAGPGSSPQIVAEVSGQPAPQLSWFKDGQLISERDLRLGHVEILDLPTDKPNVVKQALKINDLRPTNVAAYHVKAENPSGQVESEPTNVRLDRRMSAQEKPKETPAPVDEVDEQPTGGDKQPIRDDDQQAPTIVSVPEEVLAGRGGSPQIEAEVAGSPAPQLTWLKDGQPISERDLRTGHVEIVDLPVDQPDHIKQALKINDLRPTDVADYQVKAENPLGSVESQPTSVKIDRSMDSTDKPVVKGLPVGEQTGELASKKQLPEGSFAPTIVSMPEEVVAGRSSSPTVEAVVAGKPAPEITWFKDGQPITPEELKSGQLEVIDLPCDRPDTVKQALKINDLKPADVAAYHVKAENPLGEVESEPTNVRIDRSMAPDDKPQVTGVELPEAQEIGDLDRPCGEPAAPKIISAPEEIVTGLGSHPQIEAEVSGSPAPQLTWLKDGQPVSDRDLRMGHVEIVDLPTDKPDVVKQALKINDMRPTDVADYQVKADNPLGSVESQPIGVKLDRRMSSFEKPVVKGLEGDQPEEAGDLPSGQRAPKIISMPKEIVAGPGSSPQIEAEIQGEPKPQLTWFKDGVPIRERQLSLGHLEIIELPTNKPGVVKQALKINDLRPTDVAAYHVKAENPLGEVESQPTQVRVDRSMSARDEPKVEGLPAARGDAPIDLESPKKAGPSNDDLEGMVAPTIVSMPEELVAGPGSSPQIVAEVSGKPAPQLSWLKDGQPISERDLRTGHVEIVDLPTQKPDFVRQALKINDLRPTDVAAYQVKAENPLGEAESQPTNVRLDRRMSSQEAPKITGEQPTGDSEVPMEGLQEIPPAVGPRRRSSAAKCAPQIVGAPSEVIAAPGSSPKLEVQVKAQPEAQVQWLKDGEPIPARLLRDKHVEPLEEATALPGVIKYALQVNDLRPSDVAPYTLKAENPLGSVESAPIQLKTDRSMSKSEEPIVKEAPSKKLPGAAGDDEMVAPRIVSAPDEIVAGPESCVQIEAQVSGVPKPDLSWFKDGTPITERDLASGHLELVELPSEQPDVVRQALRINDLKPADVAAYHVKAENPLGEVESQPTNVRIDRSMGPLDEPKVTGVEQAPSGSGQELIGSGRKPTTDGEGRFAPEILSTPKEVVAGMGSSPELVAEIAGNPAPQLTWLKDGQPISERDMRTGHLELVDLPTNKPDVVKQALKINDMRPSDVAPFSVVAENPLGKVESEPIQVKMDRRMSSIEAPVVKGLDAGPLSAASLANLPEDAFAPTIVSMPEEVVAGRGSSPTVEAVVAGKPAPEITWYKDGQPIAPEELKSDHLDVIDLPCDRPDTVKQALKINDLKPNDVAAYHVKAENPLGEIESEPTNVRIDRSMGPKDEPKVIGETLPDESESKPVVEKPRIAQLPRNVKCPLGSSPVLDVEILGGQPDKIEWLKDGAPIREKPDMHVEFESLPDGTQKLQINNFKPEDVGVYTLRATNAAGVAESGPISVTATTIEAPRRDSSRPEPAEEFAPEILNTTEEVIAGPGSHPQLEVHVRAQPAAEVTWYKDGKPLTERQLGVGHVALVEQKSPFAPDAIQYTLKIDRLKPTDAATYHLVAKNPLGTAESKPIQLKLDKALEADETPLVRQTHEAPATTTGERQGDEAAVAPGDFAPQIISNPNEVVAGVGSSPVLEAAIKARPAPETTWFKDGAPLSDQELASGHFTIVREVQPSDADVVIEKLVIEGLKPADVAAYHVRAENPLGDVESEPTNVRIDRSMGPKDEPQVSQVETPFSPEEALASNKRALTAPTIKRIPRKIVAPLGSNPVIEVEIAGEPKPEVIWFKDGRQVSDVRGHLALVEQPDGTHKLCLTNLKAVDQGDYTIKAINELGEIQSSPISLIIDSTMAPTETPKVIDSSEPIEDKSTVETPLSGFAPMIKRVSERVTGDLGGKAQIQVEVHAAPEANVSWILDGQQIPSRLFEEGHLRVSSESKGDDTTVYTLDFGSMKPSDAGTYKLEAENPFGSVISPSILVGLRSGDDTLGDKSDASPKRQMRAPKIKRAPGRVVAREGTSPVLEVEVSGEPVPEIHWFRNGVRLDRGDTHFTFDERPDEGVFRLIVNECSKVQDEATYTLQATNEAGTCESGPIELKIEASTRKPATGPAQSGFAPQIISSTEEVVAGTGSSPLVEVVIKSSPKAQVSWFKDGQEIDLVVEKRKFKVVEEKIDSETSKFVLQIIDLRPIDMGAYHARAENVHGCCESEPSNVRIDRSMDATDAPLTTKSQAAPEDEDQQVATGTGPSDGSPASTTKKPLRAPTIKRMPRRIVAPLGSNPVIEIEISGSPKPEIVWYKNGKRVTEVRNRIEFVETPDGTYKLCFTDVKITDQAEYSVVATNEAGTVDSGPIELIVDRSLPRSMEPCVQESSELPSSTVVANDEGPIEAPKIFGLDDTVEALPGGTIKLEAEVSGNPRPEIKWLKDGDEVELNIVNEVPDSNKHSLTLRNVNDLYDGVYSLEAKNEAGVARKDAKVKIVDELSTPQMKPEEVSFKAQPVETTTKRKSLDEPREKPFIKRGLKFSQVNQGRSIKFEVQIDGKYDELVWMKDGEQINLPSDHTLTIDGVDVEQTTTTRGDDDDDASTLKASDDEDDELITAGDLTSGKPKRRFPPRILMRPRNVVAGPGSRVAFEVKFEGEPRPEVVWFRNGERIETTQDGKIIIESIGNDLVRLIIEDVQASDVATYQVQLENAFGQEKSLPVSLELDVEMPASDDLANYSTADQQQPDGGEPLKRGRAPRILTRPRPIHAPQGSTIFFEVQVAGEPEPIVNWYRDGRVIKQSSDGHVRIEEFSNGCVRLVLSNITDADVGLYHVVAENKLGSERTIPVTLTIDETSGSEQVDMTGGDFEPVASVQDQAARHKRGGRPPRIVMRPKHLEAPLGGEVSLEVLVIGQSKPSIIWYKDGQRLKIDEKRIRVEKLSDSYERLIISDLKTSDSGSYTVSAENDFGISMSQPASKLIVSESSTSESKQSSMITTETTTTSTTVTTSTEFFEHFVDDDTTTVHVGESPGGGRRAPRFTLRPRNRKAPVGAKVDFEVKVSGEPKPDVVWYKNGRRVHTTSDGRVRVEEFSDGGSKLIIEDLEETDHGVYAAEAANKWGKARTEDVQLRVTQRTEVSERSERTQRGGATVTTRTKKTRSHYTFSEERRTGYVTLTINDAQLDHDGDYKLVVRNKWGEASTQAPLVVIPKVEPRATMSADRSATSYDDRSSVDGRDSRSRRTPFDELEDYGHELDRSAGIFGSESRYQSGEDTYLLQLRDTEFPLRLRKYLRFGARQSPSLRSNLMDAHWGAGARVTVRERRKFREVMDEEIDDEKMGRDLRQTPMRLQKEVGTCGYAAAQLEHLRVEAADRITRRSVEVESGTSPTPTPPTDMMPPFFRIKLKDIVCEEAGRGRSQEVIFACLAAGEPKPDYTWFKNDVIITPDISRMTIVELEDGGSELRIKDPCLFDSACFKCVARNVHGNVTSRARLRVAGKPSRPEPPEYSAVTSREVLLQWRPPRDTTFDINTAPVLGYKLEMSQSSIGQDDHWTTLAADVGHEYYVVDDLTPATSYTFRVSARNKFGWSDTSYSAYVTTCRDQEGPQRLQVPHEWRARQFVSEVCDAHLLRHCEDDKYPQHLNYTCELNPICVDSQARWRDSFAVQAEIARGRFSIISKGVSASGARDAEGRAQQVVMKFVATSCATAAQTKNEFDILRSLQHEKVVQLKAAFRDEESSCFVFVMERLSGLDVLTYLSSFTSYSEETVSQIIQQVMDAIEYLHFRGMCLLELQPDNVVMTNGRSTALKLVDFSTARFVPRSGARVPPQAHLQTGQTIEYCPPEVIAGHEVSTASDVWCIGVLTYLLLSGFSPFRAESGQEEETRENVRLGRYKYDHIYGNCTPEVTRFLINVFKKHSSKRPTIEQLYENKWLLPNEFMIKKRQHATFKTDKIAAFAEEFHKTKQQQQEAAALQQLADKLQ